MLISSSELLYSSSVLAVETLSHYLLKIIDSLRLSTLIFQVRWINVNVFYEMLTRRCCCSSWLNIDRRASRFGLFLNVSISPEPRTYATSQQFEEAFPVSSFTLDHQQTQWSLSLLPVLLPYSLKQHYVSRHKELPGQSWPDRCKSFFLDTNMSETEEVTLDLRNNPPIISDCWVCPSIRPFSPALTGVGSR